MGCNITGNIQGSVVDNILLLNKKMDKVWKRISYIQNHSGGGGTVTGANQGLSLSGTNVVLGQTLGDINNPAMISGAKEIPFDTTGLSYLTFNYAGAFPGQTIIQPAVIQIQGNSEQSSIPALRLIDSANLSTFLTLSISGDTASISKSGGSPVLLFHDEGTITISPSFGPSDVGLWIQNRKIRIDEGNGGVGKVLMSDADGIGTWANPNINVLSSNNSLPLPTTTNTYHTYTGTGSGTWTLPLITIGLEGYKVTIINASSDILIVATSGSDMIIDPTGTSTNSYTIASKGVITLYNNSLNYVVIPTTP